jgi:hypothetical protein
MVFIYIGKWHVGHTVPCFDLVIPNMKYYEKRAAGEERGAVAFGLRV